MLSSCRKKLIPTLINRAILRIISGIIVNVYGKSFFFSSVLALLLSFVFVIIIIIITCVSFIKGNFETAYKAVETKLVMSMPDDTT